MTVKEATACNVPVVSHDADVAREVLEDVSNSHVADDEATLRDRLADVLDSGERSDGRERFANYTTDEMGARLRAVYDDCLDGRADDATASSRRRAESHG